MRNHLNKKNDKGFTIIEVMIVLAIVGLIILIVFLAVPTLQRNSRNTQRKSDVGRLSSAATTVVSNFNGATVTATNFTGAALTGETGNLGFYAPGNVATSVLAAGGTQTLTPTAGTNAIDFVRVVYNGNCAAGAATASYQNRSIAVLYNVESGGGGTTGTAVCTNQ